MVGSPEINKVIREVLSPVLRCSGFSKVLTRNNWGYHGEAIWVFKIKAVGKYFSDGTGFPPMSLTAELGVYYTFFPEGKPSLKVDKDGLLLPPEWRCHMRDALRNVHDETFLRRNFHNPAEIMRKDIWYVDVEGNNTTEAIGDIKEAFLGQAVSWYKNMMNLEEIYKFWVDEVHDSPDKFYHAKYIAKRLGLISEYEKYSLLLKEKGYDW
jgi:hypothetical protein